MDQNVTRTRKSKYLMLNKEHDKPSLVTPNVKPSPLKRKCSENMSSSIKKDNASLVSCDLANKIGQNLKRTLRERKRARMKDKEFKDPPIQDSKGSNTIKNDVDVVDQTKYIGAHCSIAGGVSNAVIEAVSLGAQAFGLFVRNGRTWKLSPLELKEATKFKELCEKYKFPPHLILPHGSYLLNCGSSNSETLEKSRETLIHEMQRCEMLGLTLYNFHPGSACGGGSREDCINTIAESINLAHGATKFVKTVIENMSCQGSTVGGKFEELKSIIDRVLDKSRIGVCLDTCHSFAAGFDISTKKGFEKFMDEFAEKVGMKYLCAMHLNDSKGEVGCHLDRHENIGKGHIGLEGFSHIMKDSRLDNIPMILETPPNDYAKEIQLLYSLT